MKKPIYKFLIYFKSLQNKLVLLTKSKVNRDETQEAAIDITKQAIIDESSVLFIPVNYNIRYVKFNNVNIKIEPYKLTIINGVYCYQIVIHEMDYEKLLEIYDRRINVLQTKWDNEIINNISTNLKKINQR